MTHTPVPGPKRRKTAIKRVTFVTAVILLLLVAGFISKLLITAPKENSGTQADPATRKQPESRGLALRKRTHPSSEPQNTSADANTLAPQPMHLEKRILVIKKWNGPDDSFGLDKPPAGQEGATVGPSSVAYVQGKLCVLDNANKRILFYDKAGNLLSSVALPSKTATDLAVDASGTQLLVIDHYQDKVYKVDGDQVSLFASVAIKDDLPIGTKFAFDPAANTLFTQEVHQDGLADIKGNDLVLDPTNEKPLTVSFDRPVACVEEVVRDANGIVWVLFTLEGDFQMRRLARVDPAQGTVGTTEIAVYFPFDATRHMVATGNGVVVFAGDADTGQLISFEYGL